MTRLRYYRDEDAPLLHAIFYRAVHEGTVAHYSREQRAAWAPLDHHGAVWPDRLSRQITLVAETPSTEGPQGFMTLGWDGYLDFAYVLPEQMGTGVAAALHDGVLHVAREIGLSMLETEASHLARRFFLKCGWREVAAQSVERDGILIPNFRMERAI